MLVLGREPAHRGEAGEDQRHDARLRAAGEHRVGRAALDHLRRLADRVRAGRAGGDDRVVRALMPSEIASWPEIESTSTFGRKFGDTRSGPRSRSTSACSRMPGTPPIAEPNTIPTRVGSNPFSPASASASRPAATPSSTLRSSFRASLAETTWTGRSL